MNAETNVASTTGTPPELKSTDTSVLKTVVEPPKVEPEVVATPETETVAETLDEANEPDDAEQPAGSAKERKVPKWMKEKLAEKTRQQREAEERAAFLEQELHRKNNPPKAEPKLEDFDYEHDKHQAALIDYRVQQGIEKALSQLHQRAEQEQVNRKVMDFQARVKERAAQNPEFVETAINNPAAHSFPDALVTFIRDHEEGLDLAETLGKDPLLSASFITLTQNPKTPVEVIETLWNRVKPKETPKVELPVRVTKTPPPAKTLVGGAPAKVELKDMTTEQRIAHWKAAKKTR